MFLAGLLDLLAPPECPACALPYEPSGVGLGLCPACSPLVEPAPPARQPPAADAAICLYQGPMADAIRRFKYADQRQLLRHFRPLLTAAAPPYAGLVDAVVPIPLHPCKLRQRGWNPAALLARPIAVALGVPLRAGWLERVRQTSTQAGLSQRARTQNVRGAFRALAAPPSRILLVDDVRTTGATMFEAAGCLAAAGHTVNTLALAWALQDSDAPWRGKKLGAAKTGRAGLGAAGFRCPVERPGAVATRARVSRAAGVLPTRTHSVHRLCRLAVVLRTVILSALIAGCATTQRAPSFNDAQYLRFGVDPRAEADTLVRNYAEQGERLALRSVGQDFTALGFMDRSGRATRARIVTLRGIALALDPGPESPLHAPVRYALLAAPLPDTHDADRDGFEEVFIEQRRPGQTCLFVYRVRDVGYVDRLETRLRAFNREHCASTAADVDQDGRVELYVDVELVDFELPDPPRLRLALWPDQHRFTPKGTGDQLARFVAAQQAAREIDLDQARASNDSVSARRLAVELAALTQVLGLPEQDQLVQFDRALGSIKLSPAEQAWTDAAREHIARSWKELPALVAPEPDQPPSAKGGLAERDSS